MKKILVMIATIITLFAALCMQAQAKCEFKLDENGVLWGKGDNNHCQLGFDSGGENVEDFVKITDNVKEFTGTSTIYAIKNDNSVWAWGYNGEGNCGTGNTETVKTPAKILDNALQTNFTSGCIVLDAEGKLWVWGSNASSSLWGPNYGNIGLGDEVEFISTPTVILEDVREFSIGFVSSSKAVFAVKNNGELFGFGRAASDFGLGNTLEKVEEIDNVKKVTVSNYMAIAETNDNEVYVCGSYPIGTWSATTQTQSISSKFKKIFDDVKIVAEGYDSTAICVIKNDNNLYGWGYKPNFGMKSENKNSYSDDYTKDAIMLLEDVKDAVYVKVPGMWTRLFVLTNEGDLYISRRVGVTYYGSVGLPINGIEKNCLTLAMTNVEKILPDGTVMHKNGSVWSVGNSVLEKAQAEEVKENECISPPTKDFIQIIVDGKMLKVDTDPYIKNDRTMVPMRAIFEALGATVSWDNDTRTAIGVKDNNEVEITIGENVLYKNGEAIELDCVAEITNNRTMVPVRAISEAFDYIVEWDNEAKVVNIIDPYRRTYYTYDEKGQVAKTDNGTDYPYHYEYLYDDNGNVIREWQKTAFKNSDRLYEYVYNEKGQRISKSECKSYHTYDLITTDVPFEEVEKYFYDENGRLNYAEYPSGGRRYYIYDEDGVLIREENDKGETVKKYVYHEDGRINYTESY
ncbi:MAG: hypothetical protein IJ316_00840 [Clostridia bacterium]|nr:hypothetical protein [Clostridia bacterium]